MAKIELKDENLKALEKIARFMEYEIADDRSIDVDEALASVLAFYRRFVPYN